VKKRVRRSFFALETNRKGPTIFSFLRRAPTMFYTNGHSTFTLHMHVHARTHGTIHARYARRSSGMWELLLIVGKPPRLFLCSARSDAESERWHLKQNDEGLGLSSDCAIRIICHVSGARINERQDVDGGTAERHGWGL
jgi:hypothetical protein